MNQPTPVSKLPTKTPLSLSGDEKAIEQKIKESKANALENSFQMRSEWAKFIKWMIFLLLATQILCIFGIGLKLISFDGNKELTWIFFADTFAQTIGLGWLVVNYLFNKIDC